MHFLKLYGGGYLAMSKAKQAQLNLRIPPYVAAYTEPYQSVSEKQLCSDRGDSSGRKSRKRGMVTENAIVSPKKNGIGFFRIAADAGAFRCTAWKADAGGFRILCEARRRSA